MQNAPRTRFRIIVNWALRPPQSIGWRACAITQCR